MAFCGGGLEKDSQHIYKSAPLKKHPLSIPIKMAFCPPCWEQCLPFVYKKPISSIVLSLNSHRKMKTAPLLKNIPHLYEKNRGFGTPFWWLLVRYLQFIYKNWPSNGICAIGLSEIQWVTIKTSKWGLAPWLKIVPHLIVQKMGKMYPSLHIVYFLFTKIDCCKQKMHLSAQSKSGLGRFDPALIVVLDWLANWSWPLGPQPNHKKSGLGWFDPDRIEMLD